MRAFSVVVRKQVTQKQIITKNIIQKENGIGVKRFMAKVYTKMGLGVAATMGTALTLAPFDFGLGAFGVGAVGMFGSIYAFSKYSPTHHTKMVEDETVYYTKNPKAREYAYWSLAGSMGIMMSPVVGIYMTVDPFVIPAGIMISSYVFGGCALYSYRTTNTAISTWKVPLMIGLTGLVGMQFIGLGASLLFGANSFSSFIHSVDTFGGIGLFTLMSIYDAYIAKQMYIKGDADHLSCALTVYLDFMNLLIRIMDALAKSRRN